MKLLLLVLQLYFLNIDAIISAGLDASLWRRARCGPNDLTTQWTSLVNASVDPLPEFPRPQFTRGSNLASSSTPVSDTSWLNLNGLWEFEIASSLAGTPTNPIPFGRSLNRTILIPYPPESCLSGVGAFEDYPISTPNFTYTWSRLVFDSLLVSQTKVLTIEACDWNCTVWLNGVEVARHTGGYDSFLADISSLLKSTANELIVFAHDPTEAGPQPQGKQLTLDILHDHVDGNKYCPTSSIWGEVWIEAIPSTSYITNLRLRTNESSLFFWLETSNVTTSGSNCIINISVSLDGDFVTSSFFSCANAISGNSLPIPFAKVWAPGDPVLYDADVFLIPDGVITTDAVHIYFGLRGIALRSFTRPSVPDIGPLYNTSLGGVASLVIVTLSDKAIWEDCRTLCQQTSTCTSWIFDEYLPHNCTLKAQVGLAFIPDNLGRIAGKLSVSAGPAARPTLSGVFTFRLGYLDQGFFPDGLYRAPTDDALLYDVKAAPALGFNTIRVHTKVNSKRFYYHCDHLGIMVLQDAVQKFGGEGYPITNETVPLFLSDFKRVIDDRGNAPSIIQFNIFNEGDCVDAFNVSDVVNWAVSYDGLSSAHGVFGAGHVFDTNSGGPANSLFIGDVNDVHNYPEPSVPMPSKTQFSMIGEFSGLGFFPSNKNQWRSNSCYAYETLSSGQDFVDKYCKFVENLSLETVFVSGAIATQYEDLECECDGFFAYDRTLKFNETEVLQITACNKALIKSAGT
jgi:hypothetical protein